MAKSGINHVVSAVPVPRSAYESEEHHALVSGTSFPASPVEKQLFYRTDLHKLYIYNGSSWVDCTSQGVTVHNTLTGRDAADAHPLAAITDLSTHITDFTTHKAALLSTTDHPNSNYCQFYYNESIATIVASAAIKCPALVATGLGDPLATVDVSDWYGASGAYRQADAANCTATNIRDADAAFPASIIYTMVKWASDAAGTLNIGIGVITAVPNTQNLTIAKCSGVNFANSYYYWIKHSECTVQVTGLYDLAFQIAYYPAEADKTFAAWFFVYSGANAPSSVGNRSFSTPIAASCFGSSAFPVSLTAGYKFFMAGYSYGTTLTATLYGTDPYYGFSLFLKKKTA